MKKNITLLLILLLLILSVPLTSCSKYGPAPEIEQVYDRVVEVVEASHEVNVLLFGAGLPVYPRGDAEDTLVHRYYGVTDNGLEYVTPYAKFATLEEMQTAIAEVYGSDYRTSLSESLFTGFVDSALSAAMPARYSEDEHALYQNTHVEPLVSGIRVYDYASMRIADGSNGKYIRVEMESYPESDPENWSTSCLTFVYEEGNWYLDSPSC